MRKPDVPGNHDPIIQQPPPGRSTVRNGSGDLSIEMKYDLPEVGNAKAWMTWSFKVYEVKNGVLKQSSHPGLKWVGGAPEKKVEWRTGATFNAKFEPIPVMDTSLIVIFYAEGRRGRTVKSNALPVPIVIALPTASRKKAGQNRAKARLHGTKFVS